jgi:hypothetical protein
MEAHKSDIQAHTEVDSTAVSALEKFSDNNSNTIKEGSKCAQEIGSAIGTMLSHEGAIIKQKIN